jgi:hypothetical protein
MFSSSIYLLANGKISFFFMVELLHFLYQLMDTLDWSHSLAIVNHAAVNMGVQVSQFYADFQSFRYMPRSGLTWSDGGSVFSFWGTPMLISIMATVVYILTNSV